MGARCDACGNQNEPKLYARFRSLRPEDVRFDRTMCWVAGLLTVGLYMLALSLDEFWFAVLAVFTLVLWVQAIQGIRTGRRMVDRSRAERAQPTKIQSIILGGLLLMSLPISAGQDWSHWSWEWSAAYAFALLWTWWAPVFPQKGGAAS